MCNKDDKILEWINQKRQANDNVLKRLEDGTDGMVLQEEIIGVYSIARTTDILLKELEALIKSS